MLRVLCLALLAGVALLPHSASSTPVRMAMPAGLSQPLPVEQLPDRQTIPYGRIDPSMGQVVPVGAGVIGLITEAAHLEHLLHMDISRLLALAAGLTVGQAAVEILFPGAHLGFVGMVAGAMLGSWWYENHVWPFEPVDAHGGAVRLARQLPMRKTLTVLSTSQKRKPID